MARSQGHKSQQAPIVLVRRNIAISRDGYAMQDTDLNLLTTKDATSKHQYPVQEELRTAIEFLEKYFHSSGNHSTCDETAESLLISILPLRITTTHRVRIHMRMQRTLRSRAYEAAVYPC